MNSNRKRRIRRHRRQWNAVLRFGWGAKPHHTLQTGRTGSVHEKQLQGARPPAKAPPVRLFAQGGQH